MSFRSSHQHIPANVRFKISAYRKDLRSPPRWPPKAAQNTKMIVDATKDRTLPTKVGMETAGSQPMVKKPRILQNNV